MVWNGVFLLAEVLAAASLAAVRPFLSLLLVLSVARMRADLPASLEWVTSAPILTMLTVLAVIEHWRKWREQSGVVDLGRLKHLPTQAKAALGGVLVFEALRVAGPDAGVDILRRTVAQLGEKMPDMIVHALLGLAVAVTSAALARLHHRVERGVTDTLGGSRWPARIEGATVGGAATVVALSTWAVWFVALFGVLLIIGVGAFFVARRGVREGARRPCPSCAHRVAENAQICPKCGAPCAPA